MRDNREGRERGVQAQLSPIKKKKKTSTSTCLESKKKNNDQLLAMDVPSK